jgi:hypothetical protein
MVEMNDLNKIFVLMLICWGENANTIKNSGQGMKLTTHLHLVLRSKNVWRYTSTPPIHLHGMVLS